MSTFLKSKCHERHTVVHKMSECGSDLIHLGTEPVCLNIGFLRLLTFNFGSSLDQQKKLTHGVFNSPL